MKERKKGTSNKLSNEKSPYLLQHADNPVDWYPWGEEAFQKAKEHDKPVFLSIGYSTCHWCHVMAHESFEDEEVARLMNDAFVSIKVDREERPDVDSAYMAASQMLTGGGGWPLTVIMTPDKKPFFAATYIPKKTRYGRVGMLDLVPRVNELWTEQRDKAIATANGLTANIKRLSKHASGNSLGRPVIQTAYTQLSELYDEKYGGFGRAPKFPSPHNLLFLLRHWKRTGSSFALFMVEKTLVSMKNGGLFDQLGFGFHRYSTDEKWLVPHFEKMLYDQAMLAMTYTEAYEATGKKVYKETAEQVLDYVLRDLKSPLGGFYSAEDADSEGVEGKYYLWTMDEIKSILTTRESELSRALYNLAEGGNYLDEATRTSTGKNILHQEASLEKVARDLNLSPVELENGLEKVRIKLFKARLKRVRPARDEKVLADWNGLMIAALAKAARAFNNEIYSKQAVKAAEFILTKMTRGKNRLYHSYKDGEAGVNGFLDDYSFNAWGLIELYESTFNLAYLKKALELTEAMLEHFWDNESGGFFFTPDDGEKLIVRKKEIYDGAVPSGNSVVVHNLLRLSRITGNPVLEEKAIAIIKAFSRTVALSPAGYAHLLSAVDYMAGPSREVVIVGDPAKKDTKELIKALRKGYRPNNVAILKTPGKEGTELSKIAPYTKDYKTSKSAAAAYVCNNYSCSAPTTDPAEMVRLLDNEAI